MGKYLIDTNIISAYLSASLPINSIEFLDGLIDAVPNISVISQIELLCWNTNDSTSENIKSFISESTVLNINSDVIVQCVTIRKGRKIKTPDAIIAATAIANNLILITNDAEFKKIPRLKIIDPKNI